MTNRAKFNDLKKLVNEKGDAIAKILVEIAEDEMEFLDKQFIDKDRPFSKDLLDFICKASGLIDKSNTEKLLKIIQEEKKNPRDLMFMIMDIFFITRSTYEFGDDLYKAYPSRYEYEKAANVEEIFDVIINKRIY